jgi:hypothetical protein
MVGRRRIFEGERVSLPVQHKASGGTVASCRGGNGTNGEASSRTARTHAGRSVGVASSATMTTAGPSSSSRPGLRPRTQRQRRPRSQERLLAQAARAFRSAVSSCGGVLRHYRIELKKRGG